MKKEHLINALAIRRNAGGMTVSECRESVRKYSRKTVAELRTILKAGTKTMKRKPVHLEGSLLVEMKNGDRREIICEPFDDTVHHVEAGIVFGMATLTPEAEFRANMRRVLSRSSYDKR